MSTSLAKTTALSPLIERALLGSAAAIGLFFLIRAGLTILEPSRAYKPQLNTAQTSAAGAAATNQSANRAEIETSFDPFHRLIDERLGLPAQKVIGEDAPETDLNLTLKGRRASGNGQGSATIKLPDGQETPVQQGDVIIKGVTLEAVYPTHIIISRKGTQERVTFERPAGLILGSDDAPAETNVPSQRLPSKTTAPEPSSEAPAQFNPRDAGKFSKRRAPAAQRKNSRAFTAAPRDLLASLRPAPVRKDGRFVGYRINSTAGASQLNEFGFKNSDVITQIDGRVVPENATELSALFKRLNKDSSSSTFTVQRDGQLLTLSINN